MGHLYDRMAEDLVLRNFSPATQRLYLLYCRQFVAHFMRPPEQIGEAESRQYLLHQFQVRQRSYTTYRQIYAALKFLGHPGEQSPGNHSARRRSLPEQIT